MCVIKIEEVEAPEGRLDLFLRGERYAINAQRTGDVLDLVLAEVKELQREPVANLRINRFGDAYSARE